MTLSSTRNTYEVCNRKASIKKGRKRRQARGKKKARHRRTFNYGQVNPSVFALFSVPAKVEKKWESVSTFWYTFRGNQKWTHDKTHFSSPSVSETLAPEFEKGKVKGRTA